MIFESLTGLFFLSNLLFIYKFIKSRDDQVILEDNLYRSNSNLDALEKELEILRQEHNKVLKEKEELKKNPSDDLRAFLKHLFNSGSMLEIKSVDKDHLFMYSPRS